MQAACGLSGVAAGFTDFGVEWQSAAGYLAWSSAPLANPPDTRLYCNAGACNTALEQAVAECATPAETTLTATNFVVYPGYSGPLTAVAGSIGPVTTDGTMQSFRIDLSGVDDSCSEAANSCGIAIHAGTSCASAGEIGGHYYKAELLVDPWTTTSYSQHDIDGTGNASGYVSDVNTGYGSAAFTGRAVVLCDGNGDRIACALLETVDAPTASPTSDGVVMIAGRRLEAPLDVTPKGSAPSSPEPARASDTSGRRLQSFDEANVRAQARSQHHHPTLSLLMAL